MPAATPTSSEIDNTTSQGDGPTAESLASPSGPPESAASTPATTPALSPHANPHSGATSYVGDERFRGPQGGTA